MLPTKLAESKTPTALCEPVCCRYVCAFTFPRPVSRRSAAFLSSARPVGDQQTTQPERVQEWNHGDWEASRSGRHPTDCANRAAIIFCYRSPTYASTRYFNAWYTCQQPAVSHSASASLYIHLRARWAQITLQWLIHPHVCILCETREKCNKQCKHTNTPRPHLCAQTSELLPTQPPHVT